MSFIAECSSYWPEVNWTGSSHIHVSLYLSRSYHGSTYREKLKSAMDLRYAHNLFRFYRNSLPDVDWILSEQDFVDLCYTDLYRLMRGGSDIHTPTKLKNPVTGNVFNKIGLYKDLALGIRFWFEGMGLGARLRIERMIKTEKTVREETAETVAQAKQEIEEILTYMEFQEPEKAKELEAQPIKEIQ